MNGVTRLYTPELLGLAVRLADYPFDDTLEWQGAARSPSCGSTLDLGLTLDPQGRMSGVIQPPFEPAKIAADFIALTEAGK